MPSQQETPMINKIEKAINKFKSYLGKPRSEYEWLKGRPHMLDCASGYSYITGGEDVISCAQHRQHMLNNKTWIQNTPTQTKRPVRGQAIIFDWQGNYTDTAHIGLVLSVDKKNDEVEYISANSSPDSRVNIRKVGFRVVTGWGWVNLKPIKTIIKGTD